MHTKRDTALVHVAQGSDAQACEELVTGGLPLVYNVIGRALNGHPDTHVLVEDVMLQAVFDVAGLQTGLNARSWLTQLAMDRVWEHVQGRPLRGESGQAGGEAVDTATAPTADFVEVTVTHLNLSGPHLELVTASRWLGPADQIVLSLWWLQCAGELTRPDVVAALQLSAQHTAVRVQQMKARLDCARVVVRALEAPVPCPVLHELLTSWDGIPSSSWRKHIFLHTNSCLRCSDLQEGLQPSPALLAHLPLLPPPTALTATIQQLVTRIVGSTRCTPQAPVLAPHDTQDSNRRSQLGRRAVVAGAVVALAATSSLYLPDGPVEPSADAPPPRAPLPQATPPASLTPAAPSLPSPSTSIPVPTSRPPSPAVSSPAVIARTTPPPSPTTEPPPQRTSAASSRAERVITLVNEERARAGCDPVNANSTLATAAQAHSRDMAERKFFDHTNPDGDDPGQRIIAAGYRWSTYGENIARGQQSPTHVMNAWMNSPGHRHTILNCAFKEIGIGIYDQTGGPWWTQVFATP